MITQKDLKVVLKYSPETGYFFWKKGKRGRATEGSVAGRKRGGGYIYITINNKQYLAHRLAWLYMYGKYPTHTIDHINGNPIDNRLKNLRDVPHHENHKNRKLTKGSKTGISGVNLYQDGFRVFIKNQGDRTYLGYFDDFFEACCARKSAERLYNYHQNHGRR